ncbi:MAG: peptidoglycan editing factor PgeF [Bacteroidota bacterium]
MSEIPRVLPTIFASVPGVHAAMSTRVGGVSRAPLGMNLSLRVGDDEAAVHENRSRFFGALGTSEADAAFAAQCHSATIVRVDRPGVHQSCDALVTQHLDIVLAVSVADCVPILISDRQGTLVAAIHAGWRGSKQHVVANTVGLIRQDQGVMPNDLLAFIGPCAGPCCYEVGAEVSVLFHGETVRQLESRTTLDLAAENRRQLERAGLASRNIETDGRCTICGSELFHSYRRDGEASGRMLAAIMISGEK